METNSNEVTAPVDTQAAIMERFEVETNVEPEKVETEAKPEPKPEADSDMEPNEEPQESKQINPRTAARKAEKERLLRETAEARAEAAQARAELAKYKQPSQPEQPKPKDLSVEPSIQDYDDALEYADDRAVWRANQVFEDRTSKAAQQKQVDAYNESYEIARADKPDFDEKVGSLVQSNLVTPEIESAVLSSDMKAELSYHLANYSGDLMTLRGLPKELLPKAIKEIEAFIKKGGEPQEKPRVTQASPPITPPSNTGRTNRSPSSYTQDEIENMPLTEYQRIFMKK